MARVPFRWQALGYVGISLVLLMAGALPASHLAAQQTSPLPPDSVLTDKWQNRVPVSGGLRVGLMSHLDSSSLDPGRFYAWVPAESGPRLCVEISSRDGRYEGGFAYNVTEATGKTAFAVETTYLKRLGDTYTSSNQIAILARLADHCGARDGTFVVGSWDGRAPTDGAVVLLNSRVPTDVVLSRKGRIVEEARCVSLPGSSVTYNLECTIPLDWFGTDAKVLVRKRERMGGRVSDSYSELPLANLNFDAS